MTNKPKIAIIVEASDKASKEIKKIEEDVKKFQSALKGAALIGAAKMTFELAKLGAQSARTRNAFVNISGGADEATERLDAMKRATRGALSEQNAMSAANRLMQMGLATNATELENVTNMAVKLGTAMGRTATASIEEFALLLANQSIPRLDTFGISAGKVRARIAELMAATPGLSRETAFMTATFEEGEEAMARLGDTVDDDMLAFERLEATTDDLIATIGEGLAPSLADAAEAGNLLLNWTNDIQSTMVQHAQQVLMTADSYEEYATEIQRAAGGRIPIFLLSEAQWELARSADAVNEAMGPIDDKLMRFIRSAEDVDIVVEETSDSLLDLSTSARTVAGSFDEMVFDDEQLWNLAMASGASVEALGILAQQLGIATDAEIQASLEGWRLIEAFGEGKITADQLATGFSSLETQAIEAAGGFVGLGDDMSALKDNLFGTVDAVDTFGSGLAAIPAVADEAGALMRNVPEEAEDAFVQAGDAIIESWRNVPEEVRALASNASAATQAELEVAARNIPEVMGAAVADTDTKMAELPTAASAAAQGMNDAIREIDTAPAVEEIGELIDWTNKIPRDITINVQVKTTGDLPPGLQRGTPFWHGGMAWVGEGGPELVALPRGSRVFSALQSQMMAGGPQTSISSNKTLEGNTFNTTVNDASAAALLLSFIEEQRTLRLNEFMGIG